MPSRRFDDDVSAALDALMAALHDDDVRDAATRRAEAIRRGRSVGEPYRELVGAGGHPLLVELVTEHLEKVATAGARLRRAEAAALYAEGLTMEQIADAFGVTRQRVSAILKEARARGLLDDTPPER